MVTFGFDRRYKNSKSKGDSRCSSSSASTSRNSSSHHILQCRGVTDSSASKRPRANIKAESARRTKSRTFVLIGDLVATPHNKQSVKLPDSTDTGNTLPSVSN